MAEVTKTKAPMWSNLIGLYSIGVFAICFGLPPATAAQLEVPCLTALTCIITVAHLLFGRAVVSFFGERDADIYLLDGSRERIR